jgi:hypothetical protein
MVRSHTPASRASTTTPAALDAQLDPEVAAEQSAENSANPPARTGEGPASSRASEAPPSPCSPRPLRWDDPDDARAWLASARSHVADLAALAREGCRRSKDRVLSRAERGRQTRAAEHALLLLLNAADAGLRIPPPPEGEQGE